MPVFKTEEYMGTLRSGFKQAVEGPLAALGFMLAVGGVALATQEGQLASGLTAFAGLSGLYWAGSRPEQRVAPCADLSARPEQSASRRRLEVSQAA